MSDNAPTAVLTEQPVLEADTLLEVIQRHFEASREVRRGICLLNVGQHTQAVEAFSRAAELGCVDRSLPSYLAACYLAKGQPTDAADTMAKAVDAHPSRAELRIRQALSQWAAGMRDEAITTLRAAISINPEHAELHFQLGTLLTLVERYDEAELRFTQALNLDGDHTDSLVSLAMCCGVRNAPDEAFKLLQRAQSRRPYDARIGLLLAQAAKAVSEQGEDHRVRAVMPEDELEADCRGVDELSSVIQQDPGFVDAFLSLPSGMAGPRIFAMLLRTLEVALERQPEHAELHFHCGRVLERLGRHDEAINRNERAVKLDPRFTRALIELGRLYHRTDRNADAATRLEQAVAAGAEYPDVYFMLGNVYRQGGEVTRARDAYEHALDLNGSFAAARNALAALSS